MTGTIHGRKTIDNVFGTLSPGTIALPTNKWAAGLPSRSLSNVTIPMQGKGQVMITMDSASCSLIVIFSQFSHTFNMHTTAVTNHLEMSL